MWSTVLYVLRHGEYSNGDEYDSLTEEWIEQSQLIAKIIWSQKYDIITVLYMDPKRKRVGETADEITRILELDLQVKVSWLWSISYEDFGELMVKLTSEDINHWVVVISSGEKPYMKRVFDYADAIYQKEYIFDKIIKDNNLYDSISEDLDYLQGFRVSFVWNNMVWSELFPHKKLLL